MAKSCAATTRDSTNYDAPIVEAVLAIHGVDPTAFNHALQAMVDEHRHRARKASSRDRPRG